MNSDSRIMQAHGGGGQLTDDLLRQAVLPKLDNAALSELLDSGLIDTSAGRLALTIDSYVVQPLFFPGGDIGRLAVCGTVNDLAVTGAKVQGLALSLILEEGLERQTLDRVMESIRAAADEAGAAVITGDTKVIGRGAGDGMYITTAGVGIVPEGRRLHPDRIQAGDRILVSGTLADHGLAVMLARQMPEAQGPICSDAAPLNGLIAELLDHVEGLAFLRDATRGGVAGVAVDIAQHTGLHVVLEEAALPVHPYTRHAADLLGLDILEVANEGKVIAVVRPEQANAAVATMRTHPLGASARIIGEVTPERDGICELHTAAGGRRIVQKPYGEQLPRIC